MPVSKQESRFNDSADQQRRLFNNTQNQDSTRTQTASASSTQQKPQKKEQNLGPSQLLAEHMDATGNPVPDTPTKRPKDEDYDVFQAMNAETEDFD
ncbi:hypothetical protein N7478_004953 [Penicillium angulare]|uniref:uncharacterized protein n=1 Tax=Penicillium angulare TaxID=116970 RepID=UPI00253FE1B6|nr:uncharacterized protein N7478_004953 [Penicillium angulare]KAJ5279581.1 hypothetical protein N7478_004953 [Penicillium angulare]